jgi:uncharacterized RDD family membrane protein YckC
MNGSESTNPTKPVDLPEIVPPELADGSPGSAEPEGQDCAIPSGEDAPEWRDEVTARLSRYRARRKPQPPRYPSLRLRFEPEESFRGFSLAGGESLAVSLPAFESMSDHALALDGSATTVPATPGMGEIVSQSLPPAGRESSSASILLHSQSGARIIEFPRSGPPGPPRVQDELAQPVMEGLRILEAPEVTLPPALGGIMIDAGQQKEVEKRPGIDVPLQSAPLPRRIAAAAVDGAIVGAGSILFAFIFREITAVRPPQLQILELGLGIPCLLWAVYQYLLIVYSGTTPGLWSAGLELTRFDGTRPNRHRRRWRVVASYLSAISLGMGYAWLLLDEDALSWHDRITHTYLAPIARQSRRPACPPQDRDGASHIG